MRKSINEELSNQILTEAHHRCCICPEHRMIANIHHIDMDNSNNTYDNLVAVCAECHADLHTKSTMRRNITKKQILIYKKKWKGQCEKVELELSYGEDFIRQQYYINVHRLESLFSYLTGESMIKHMPYQYTNGKEFYNTLWHNPDNSLSWTQLIEVRSYLEECSRLVLNNIKTKNLGLLELSAYKPEQLIGELVHFSCEFYGKDIPSQSELVKTKGIIDGPPATLRREVDDNVWEIVESCMLLDSNYFYSESAFIHLSERGYRNGIGLVGSYRPNVGSNDGPRSRSQIIITPILIGVPMRLLKSSEISDARDYEMLITG